MTADFSDLASVLVCKGRRAAASYLDQQIAAYRGNPFIEALPPILTEDEAMETLARYPLGDDSELEMDSHLRLHLIQNALQFFAPLPVHLDLERRFSRMIRAGYQTRNPLVRSFWRDVDRNTKSLSSSTEVVPNCARPIPLGFTIIGFPGVGKSTSVEAILSLYPQVVYHSEYAGHDFNHAQIVWLKLECPLDGSIKGLCLNFFQAVDDILRTNYYLNYASGRRTLDELLPQMARVASNHGLGVLVIDEIQRLSQAKSGGAAKMLNFFVQLTNTIGVPVVLVGTGKARRILSGQFHQIRRGCGQGDLVWDRMEEGTWVNSGEECTPGVWQLFLESLWIYQYIKTPCPLTEELSHVLYEETQGITDFAAKVFMLAQARVITTADGGEEVLTTDIIRSVACDSLRQAQRVLNALRMGDTRVLEEYDDIQPIDVDTFMQESLSRLQGAKRPDSSSNSGTQEPTNKIPEGAHPSTPTDEQARPKPPVPKGRSRKRRAEVYAEGDLRIGVADGVQTGTTADESLRQAGYIQPATEYINKNKEAA